MPQSPPAKATPLPVLPEVAFEPDLKLKDHVLNGHVTLYAAPNFYRVMETTVQTLAIETNRNIRPYPQYQIETIDGTSSRTLGFPTSERPSGIVKVSGIGFAKTDLDQYKFNKSETRFIRVQVVVMQGPNHPKHWTKSDSVTYFSPWMPYKRGAVHP